MRHKINNFDGINRYNQPTKREYAIAILKLLGYVSIAILAIDFLVFCGWIISGQHPVDGFYIGSITANILKAILF